MTEYVYVLENYEGAVGVFSSEKEVMEYANSIREDSYNRNNLKMPVIKYRINSTDGDYENYKALRDYQTVKE